ncbi:vacuolar protein sorting-associated protein 41 like protein [Ditylenchus destructor]|nr:vacuolar protein sorting-associated protein 41 like protein [Ditylenchus destructor]
MRPNPFASQKTSRALDPRNFLGRRKSTVIYQGLEKDGLITAISWHGPYIAFTNESGTRIYDTKLSRTITLVQPLHKTEAYYSSKFPPRHSWLNSETLCIGWANTICVLLITTKRRISTTNTMSLNMAGTPGPKHGQILHRFHQNINLRSTNHAAKSVCIAEDFSRSGSGHRFVTSGRDLILYERNFLGRRKSTVIYQGLEKDGLITAVSWHGPYIAFTNESGTRIYDT